MTVKRQTVLLIAGLLAGCFVFSSFAKANSDIDALRVKVHELSVKRNFPAIETLISAEEEGYKENPDASHLDHLVVIAAEFEGDDPKSPSYWLFRKIAWWTLLAPLPPFSTPDEVRAAFRRKDGIVYDVIGSTSRNALSASGFVDSDARHDAAMLLMSYSNWLKSQIIPNYQNKPVAPFNAGPEAEKSTLQNSIDNEVQEQLRLSTGTLSRNFGLELAYGYLHVPKNEQEARELVDALGIQGSDRDRILEFAARPDTALSIKKWP